MIIAVLELSLTLILGMACSVFAQSDDMGSVLDKAQKSLSHNTEDNIEPTLSDWMETQLSVQSIQCRVTPMEGDIITSLALRSCTSYKDPTV